MLLAYDDADVVQVEKDVKQTLKRIHRVDPKDERAFGSFNLGQFGPINVQSLAKTSSTPKSMNSSSISSGSRLSP